MENYVQKHNVKSKKQVNVSNINIHFCNYLFHFANVKNNIPRNTELVVFNKMFLSASALNRKIVLEKAKNCGLKPLISGSMQILRPPSCFAQTKHV